VNPTTNRVYATNQADNTISVIDGGTNTVIATVPTGNAPHGITVNPVTNTIYVGNRLDNTVSVIDGSTNTVTATIPLPGVEIHSMATNTITNRIYVLQQN